ncbi:hypothetical protein [Amycolatopsis sp. NPDC051903]|uniref:hypothetical protein n=1 Tax=Amycolatopsis sp. NPDC051903 TaxID=3363936 RepID=UPI00379F73D5
MATKFVETAGKQAQSRTVRLPFGLPEFRAPDVRLLAWVPKQARHEVSATLDTARSFLPPPRKLVYFGALGVLTAAVAIGVGTAVAGRGRGSRPVKPEERSAPEKPAGKQHAPERRVQLAGQPETAGAHRPTKRATIGERPTMAGQPEVAGAHHPLAERTPPQPPQAPQPEVAAEREPAPVRREAPAKPEPAPAQRESQAEPTPAKLQPSTSTSSGAAAKSHRKDSGPAPGGE